MEMREIMSKIAILTDSSCDIPQEMAEKYGIDIMSFHILLDDVDYVERESCTNTEFYDKMRAATRLRTQIDVIASESLKGVVYFEIGDTHWGHAKDGASLGTDGRTVEVRYSYIDWAIPETDVLVRMGLQPFVMPGFVAGSAVLDGDGAGITRGLMQASATGIAVAQDIAAL